MEAIIYSANIGGYDTFKPVTERIPNSRYLLFTDQDVSVEGWEVIKVNDNREPRTVARDIKINAHEWLPKHDISVWVDHAFQIKVTSNLPVTNDVICYAHHARNCIYAEIAVCEQLGYIKEYEANLLLHYCDRVNYPYNNGLSSSGFMVRGNTEAFNKKWWRLVQIYSERDQLTQHLAAYLTGTKIETFKEGRDVYSNPYLSKKVKHLP